MATSYESFSPKFKVALIQLYPKVRQPSNTSLANFELAIVSLKWIDPNSTFFTATRTRSKFQDS